jgi:uncharacterized membrane protein YoaK (UPF0700 family)
VDPPRDDRAMALGLLALTVATGLVDAASFLGLGRIFTANMTGNVVLLGFSLGGAPGFSSPALVTSLGAFLIGAVAGGRMAVHLGRRRSLWLRVAFGLEVALVGAAALLAIGLHIDPSGPRLYAVIAVLGVAMGIRNATVRKLAFPDLTTTVLTLTLTGFAADSPPAGSPAVRPLRRIAAVVAMLLGALAGASLIDHALALPLAAAALVSLLAMAPLIPRQASS